MLWGYFWKERKLRTSSSNKNQKPELEMFQNINKSSDMYSMLLISSIFYRESANLVMVISFHDWDILRYFLCFFKLFLIISGLFSSNKKNMIWTGWLFHDSLMKACEKLVMILLFKVWCYIQVTCISLRI